MAHYLITRRDGQPFFTDWYQYENHFEHGVGMIVYDLHAGTYTIDGLTWIEIEIDHL